MVERNISPERWQRIGSLFHEALEHMPDQREGFLRGACNNEELLFEVRRLLKMHQPDDAFLDHPTGFPGGRAAGGVDVRRLAGRRVGSFRLVEPIASGGMAMVWRGERADDTFEQRVAVKVMSLGLVSGDRKRRFEQERQTLAQLEHPYITRLIDGGSTEDGLPYLVMEYIEGSRVDVYCDEHRLSIVERLRLFQRFCEAVHFAHQNLVVHRDLKPNNMLVTSGGQPKLLDFGISKLLDDTPDDPVGDATQTFVRALTPRYASPEQIRGDTITTASDVYSLGIVLYELLTGHRPFPKTVDTSAGRQNASDQLEPAVPSVVVASRDGFALHPGSTLTVTPELIGHWRGEPPTQLCRRLRGDLDNVILKALQPQPARRYASVQQFAEDIDRYVNGMPVIARKGTLSYRASKFVRRNRALAASVAAVVLALVAGIIGTSRSLTRVRAERDIAIKANEFLQGLVGTADPYRDAPDERINALLSDASRRLDNELSAQPAVEAVARFAIARTYAGLHRWDAAEESVRIALALNRALHEEEHPAVADCLTLLGRVMAHRKNPSAVKLQEDALSLRQRIYGEEHPMIAENQIYLAFALWNATSPPDYVQAAALYGQAITDLRSTPERDPHMLAIALHGLGAMGFDQRRPIDELKPLFEEAVRLYRVQPVFKDRGLSGCIQTYAHIARAQGRYDDEARIFEDYLHATPRLYAVDSVRREARWRLATLTERTRPFDESLHLYRRALQDECGWRAKVRPAARDEWLDLQRAITADLGVEEVTVHATQIIRGLPRIECPDNRALSERMVSLGDFAGRQGYHEAAHALLNACLRYQQEQFPSDQGIQDQTRGALGAHFLRTGETERAAELLIKSYHAISSRYGNNNWRTHLAAERMASYYESLGNTKKAEWYRAKFPPGSR